MPWCAPTRRSPPPCLPSRGTRARSRRLPPRVRRGWRPRRRAGARSGLDAGCGPAIPASARRTGSVAGPCRAQARQARGDFAGAAEVRHQEAWLQDSRLQDPQRRSSAAGLRVPPARGRRGPGRAGRARVSDPVFAEPVPAEPSCRPSPIPTRPPLRGRPGGRGAAARLDLGAGPGPHAEGGWTMPIPAAGPARAVLTVPAAGWGAVRRGPGDAVPPALPERSPDSSPRVRRDRRALHPHARPRAAGAPSPARAGPAGEGGGPARRRGRGHRPRRSRARGRRGGPGGGRSGPRRSRGRRGGRRRAPVAPALRAAAGRALHPHAGPPAAPFAGGDRPVESCRTRSRRGPRRPWPAMLRSNPIRPSSRRRPRPSRLRSWSLPDGRRDGGGRRFGHRSGDRSGDRQGTSEGNIQEIVQEIVPGVAEPAGLRPTTRRSRSPARRNRSSGPGSSLRTLPRPRPSPRSHRPRRCRPRRT